MDHHDRETSKTTRPAESLRDRDLEASIWRNGTKEEPRFNTSFRKSYRDDDGDWQETQSYSSNDLLRLAELARKAHDAVNWHYRDHYQNRTSQRDKDDREAHKESRSRKGQTRGGKRDRTAR